MTATRSSPRAALPLVDGPACCPGGISTPMERAEADALAHLLKAVADPARLQLLAAIRASEAGEVCVCDLTAVVGLSQPTVSHHLKVLTDAGLLRREKRGTWAWYALAPERLAELGTVLG